MINKIRGFTLIELMLTVIVAAILLAIAVPSFRAFIQNNQLTTATNQFVTALNMARSEAVKRGRRVYITAAASSAGDEWGGGFRVWLDENGNGTYQSANDQELQVWAALDGGVTIDSTKDRSEFVFASDGVVDNGDTIEVCDGERAGEVGRKLDIDPTGRVSIIDDNYSGCL
ncbi:hypothetical protein KBTX_03563 [wastewater metagenome]|uniref:Cytochrome oxidase subunit II transmembrane region profile domain-containing protein n=2 Tax=unclassified sequences TaxID=12908 RepID=A0A5B8RJG0_9ZZZZ|nr:GspH/FimT family pseudopilin [Arhodomonas sp. KWT]QEA07215.1 hypothetical protein KBTEX_03563 [uncultured organism]